MSRHKIFPVVLCVSLLAGCAREETSTSRTPAPTAAPAVVADAGGIAGTVTFEGRDTDQPLNMERDPVCAGLHKKPVDLGEIAVRDGKLANVFVYVKSGAGVDDKTFPVPAEKKVIDQQGCLYRPRVLGVQVGQAVTFKNSDDTLHNVHALPAANEEFNQGQPQGFPPFDKTFDKPEVMVHVQCEVHNWMSSWIGVLPHPFYAVSGGDGAFAIKNLPPGRYTIEAWHETLGTQDRDVTVGPNQTVDVSFDFKGK
jgi:plastocyanin